MVHTMVNTLGTPVRAKEEWKGRKCGQRTQGEWRRNQRGGREEGGCLGLLPTVTQTVCWVKTLQEG